jgi:sialate O-acetylesterase
LARDDGQKDQVRCGPLYQDMKIEGGKIRLSFDHTGSGLVAKDGSLV